MVLSSPAEEERRKDALKMQKASYRSEKKRLAGELVQVFRDPTVVVMNDWLKIRGTLKKWTKLYCVLKPGMLLLYKSNKPDKYGYWVGTVLLSGCELIERPSKKDGFCFKLFHPMEQSIWAARGPRNESYGAVTQPLPSSYLICRAASEEAGTCWMDALELALRCSSLLMRTMSKLADGAPSSGRRGGSQSETEEGPRKSSAPGDSSPRLENVATGATIRARAASDPDVDDGGAFRCSADSDEAERHFRTELEDGSSPAEEEEEEEEETEPPPPKYEETAYVASPPEVFGALGEGEQTEEFADENKSLMWTLMKQVRPGMDLSKVVLPTFILEPRSFLEKLADYYYHSHLLVEAVKEPDPYHRMKEVVRFYLSGFYKKPKGLKKPYNPILGEVFRCYWQHEKPEEGRSFYIAEQVSHHPPVSAFHVSNRQGGFNVCGSILAKSKFYGNSLSAVMVGSARVTLLERGEAYVITMPYAHCKGLILGTLTMELGGSVSVVCERTSYAAELEFKLKPFLGGADVMNSVSGKIRLGKQVLADISGHWDGRISITERKSGATETLWEASPEAIKRRLPRYTVPLAAQLPNESERLWARVTAAVVAGDQVAATEEKTVLEEAQRAAARKLRETGETHEPALFAFDNAASAWLYKEADYRPWDPLTDLAQSEGQLHIFTRAKTKTPLLRSSSLVSGSPKLAKTRGGSVDDDDEEEETMRVVQAKSLGSAASSESGLGREELAAALRPITDSVADLRRGLFASSGEEERRGLGYGQFLLILGLLLGLQAAFFTWLLRRELGKLK